MEQELSTLGDLVLAVDRELTEIIDKCAGSNDPDAFGYFDAAEHATSLGLVSCQTYIATVCGGLQIEKPKAMRLGPKHPAGLTKVQIVNHAANYWKHNNEWSLDRTANRQAAIETAFDSVGLPVETDYPLSGILIELTAPEPASLRAVVSILKAWKAELLSADA